VRKRHYQAYHITWIRNFAERKEFPQEDPVGPDIRLTGKGLIRQGFNGHPFDWQRSLNEHHFLFTT
jgi:hypothetical protein